MNLLVLGGGPAGVSAALQARELGADVTLVEANRVGGTILNDGPAPVRTLARAARLVRDAGSWERFGLRGDAPEVDVGTALANAKRVADTRTSRDRWRSSFVTRGSISSTPPVRPGSSTHTRSASPMGGPSGGMRWLSLSGDPARPNIPGAELALTYSDLHTLQAVPASVAVVGGADTGCQLASILADFGATVSLLEGSPRLVPRSDSDLSEGLRDSFRNRGIDVHTEPWSSGWTRRQRGHHSLPHGAGRFAGRVDVVFFAVGWPGNADESGRSAIGL